MFFLSWNVRTWLIYQVKNISQTPHRKLLVAVCTKKWNGFQELLWKDLVNIIVNKHMSWTWWGFVAVATDDAFRSREVEEGGSCGGKPEGQLVDCATFSAPGSLATSSEQRFITSSSITSPPCSTVLLLTSALEFSSLSPPDSPLRTSSCCSLSVRISSPSNIRCSR